MIESVPDRRHRILGYVREYMANHDARRAHNGFPRRRARKGPPELEPIRRYVALLEQVLAGDKAHRRGLRDANWSYVRQVKLLRNQARAHARASDYALADYLGAARVYVHALENQLKTSSVPNEVLEEMRRFYMLAAKAVLTQTGEDGDVDAPNTQE